MPAFFHIDHASQQVGSTLICYHNVMPNFSSTLPQPTFAWLKKQLPAEITYIEPLKGATSSHLYRIDCANSQSFVLRRHTLTDWLELEPDLARHEAMALQWLKNAAVPTPELVAYDEFAEETDVPAILMTHLPGKVNLQPENLDHWLEQLALALLPIHALNGEGFGWEYYPYNKLAELKVPSWTAHPDLWQHAIHILNTPTNDVTNTPTCFIHRDYHPVNVLFQDGNISGVVDFPNACRGAAGLDVGHCRNNLAHLFGVGVADRFLEIFRVNAGNSFTYHPYWDLISLSDSDEPAVYAGWVDNGIHHLTPALMRQRHDDYLVSIMNRF
jgi:aminoglycoside phosphotransferase